MLVTGTSTYTGYDAAVYAAATSYLQSKATGGSGTWLGLRKSGGTGGTRGSFPNKSRGGFGGSGGGGGGQQQLHYCEVCKISCAGPQVPSTFILTYFNENYIHFPLSDLPRAS